MKKTISLVFALALGLTACSHFTSSSEQAERSPAGSSLADTRYYEFQNLVAEAMSFRAKALQFAQEKKLDRSGNVELNRAEGEWVRTMGKKYLNLRQQLYKVAEANSEPFQAKSAAKLTPYKGTKSETLTIPGPGTRQEKEVTVFSIDPTQSEGQKKIFDIQMSLAASLILMDNYLIGIQPFQDNKEFNYLLNYDVEERKALQQITDAYSSAYYRNMIARAIRFVDDTMTWRRAHGHKTTPEESYLYSLSQSSIWYLNVRNDKYGTDGVEDAVANLWAKLTLKSKRGVRAVSYGLSMGFGNMVGVVQTRKGRMLSLSRDEKQQISSEMKPLDILLEKTPFRLTDKMIPGHYGHVAIWIGTEAQLKELGVWEKIPQEIQRKISNGHHIIEALRPGVEINTLEHFLNIDDMLVLRDQRQLSDDYRRKAILQAVAQIGKEYDFNFDVNTHERIVCSEIAYVVYDDVKWPLEKTLGRYTISPDNVAQLAVGGYKTFEPVMLYYDGKRYFKDLRGSLALLLKANDSAYAEFARLQR